MRIALRTRVRADRIEEYELAHGAVPSDVAAAMPEPTFVADHAGKPPIADGDLTSRTAAIGELAAQPDTVCRLSGLVTEAAPGAKEWEFAPVADVILSAFGPDRVMLGSDWPVCLLVSDYASVVALAHTLVSGLSDAERAAVLTATAARVCRVAISAPADDQGTGGVSWR